MCGICGIFGENAPDKVKTMIDSIKHRGPDGESISNFPWGTVGFCWLDIFGPNNKTQPAISKENKLTVVFNGEIYNFDELKVLVKHKEIIDEANLILELYCLFAEKTFEKLKGMYAIAILTPEKIILARDYIGIKPLVYFREGPKLYFASEIKSLLRVCEVNIEINEDSLAEAAIFGFIFSLDETMIRNIKQLLPGSYLTFDGHNIQITRFKETKKSFYGNEKWFNETVNECFSNLMDKSANLHVKHAKGDQAIYLSGGLDSSLMSYFLQKNSSEKLFTYNLFDDQNSEDKLYAKKIANQLGTAHIEYETNVDECIKFLPHYIYHYESLVTDGMFNVLGSLAFHILSSKIGQKHKVAYCGEGADELFGGYYWLHAHPLGVGDRLRNKSLKVNNGNTKINEYIMKYFPNDDSKEADMRKEIFDFLMGPGITNCHLWSVDRSCSAFSFEARPLYLYDDVIDWALEYSIYDKISAELNTKLIMKNYAYKSNNKLFFEISARKKIGMPSALNISLNKLEKIVGDNYIRNIHNAELPHKKYAAYLTSNIEKYLFDIYYDIFITNRGKNITNKF